MLTIREARKDTQLLSQMIGESYRFYFSRFYLQFQLVHHLL